MKNQGSGFWREVAEDTIDFSSIINRFGTFSEARDLLPFLPFTFLLTKLVSEERGTFQSKSLVGKMPGKVFYRENMR